VERKTVCVIIPAYNAESSVGDVIEGTKKYLPRVIVVNDGSTDRTEDVARRRAAEIVSLLPTGERASPCGRDSAAP